MYKLRFISLLLVFIFTPKDGHSSHFRGAVIMVRPKTRGAENEVNWILSVLCIGFKGAQMLHDIQVLHGIYNNINYLAFELLE